MKRYFDVSAPGSHHREVDTLLLLLPRVSQALFGGDISRLTDDIRALKPTILTGVPRIFNKISDSIHLKMKMEGPEQYAFFLKAMSEKIEALRRDGSVAHVHYDTVLFDKLKPILGGEVRHI